MLNDIIEEIKEIRSPKICYQYSSLEENMHYLYKKILTKYGLLILRSKERGDKEIMRHI